MWYMQTYKIDNRGKFIEDCPNWDTLVTSGIYKIQGTGGKTMADIHGPNGTSGYGILVVYSTYYQNETRGVQVFYPTNGITDYYTRKYNSGSSSSGFIWTNWVKYSGVEIQE